MPNVIAAMTIFRSCPVFAFSAEFPEIGFFGVPIFPSELIFCGGIFEGNVDIIGVTISMCI